MHGMRDQAEYVETRCEKQEEGNHAERLESSVRRLRNVRMRFADFVSGLAGEPVGESSKKDGPAPVRPFVAIISQSPEDIDREAEFIGDNLSKLKDLLGM